MDYRDLESFILGELDNKDSLFQQQRDKTTTATASNIRNHNNNKIITVRDSNQNLYSVTKNVTESLTSPPQPCTVISRNPNGGGDIKLKLTEHDLHQPSAEDFFTSVIKETSTAVITSVPQPYVERDASDDFFAIKSPVHRISTAAENAAVDGGYREPANNAMFSKDPAVDINTSGSGGANDVFSKDPTTDFFHSSSSSHEDFSITTEPTTEINETLEQALFR